MAPPTRSPCSPSRARWTAAASTPAPTPPALRRTLRRLPSTRPWRARGTTITFTLSAPLSDFNEIVTQPAFAPVKKSADRGGDGSYEVFSAGPYMLQGAWQAGEGGTFVRNPHWNRTSDRCVGPTQTGSATRRASRPRRSPSRSWPTATPGGSASRSGPLPRRSSSTSPPSRACKERSVNPRTGVVDYLVPNTKSPVFKNETVRRALAAATNRDAYVTAIGGADGRRPRAVPHPTLAPGRPRRGPAGHRYQG